jgi:hypothetical protein
MKSFAFGLVLVTAVLFLAAVDVGTAEARAPERLDGPSMSGGEGDPTGGVFGALDGGTLGGGMPVPPTSPPTNDTCDEKSPANRYSLPIGSWVVLPEDVFKPFSELIHRGVDQ